MKRDFIKIALVLIACVLVNSCTNTGKPQTDAAAPLDLNVAKKQIEDINQQFSTLFVKNDSVGVANLYTTDAKFMDAGAPSVVGRKAIQSTMAGFMKAGLTKVDFKTTGVFGCDSLLAEEGLLKLYVKTQIVSDEKYIVLWKKEDGKWKIFRDISNTNLPQHTAK